LLTDAEAAIHELRRIVQDLDSIRYRLRGVCADLPDSPQDSDSQREDDDLAEAPEPAMLLRSSIEVVLGDQIEPALRELENALAEAEGQAAGDGVWPAGEVITLEELERRFDRWAEAFKTFVFAVLRYLRPMRT
jgi:hypothetical protein